MPTSLASQLAKSVSLNAPLLSETARKKHFASSSYLFSANAKGQIDDLDSIFALASNALSQLRQMYISIAAFDENSDVHQALFSQRARETDRTLLGRQEAEEVDKAIASFMRALGPCLLETAAGRVIEWLVRRFRIQEFNVPDVLALFLPYHESPHFAKMISILTVDENSPFGFLASYKAAGKTVSRTTLAAEMLKNRDLARFVVGLLPDALGTQGGLYVHRTLLSFNTSVLLDYVSRADRRVLDAGTLAFLLPALLEPLKVEDENRRLSVTNRKDGVLGSFILFAALSQRCPLSAPAVTGLLSTMIHCTSTSKVIETTQLLTALLSLLSPQDTLDRIPQNAVNELIHLPDFTRALSSLLRYNGAEKLVLPLLSQIIGEEDPDAEEIADFLLTDSRVPENIVKEISLKLVQLKSRKRLASLHQRHPEALREAIDKLVESQNGNRAEYDQLLMDISMPEGSTAAPRDAIIASTDGEPSIRTSAVRQISKLLSQEGKSLNDEERTSLHNALLARLHDPSPDVLDALYSVSAVIIPLVANAKVLSTLSDTISTQSISRGALRVHLSFLCSAFYEAYPDFRSQILCDIILPHALFSRSKYKTALSIWETVAKSRMFGDKIFEGGVKEAVEKTLKKFRDDKTNLSNEEMAESNEALARSFAVNFQASNDYPSLLDWLLDSVRCEGDVHKRLFALLIVYQLLKLLSGEHQIDTAYRILQTINLSEIGDVGKAGDVENLDGGAMLDAAAKAIVSKPSSRSTVQKMQLSLVALLPNISRPVGVEIDWFASSVLLETKDRGIRYVYLLRAVYSYLNLTSSNPIFVMYINQKMFEQLGADSLLFLAGLWLHATEQTKYVALRHASAFFNAHSSDLVVDFQTVVPALVCTLQSGDKRVREGAMECIAILAKSASSSAKPVVVYAYEQVYGQASSTLQYLDWSDEGKYLNALIEHKEHFVRDAEQVEVFHMEQLPASRAGGKKDAKRRQRTLCYLLSHAVASTALVLRLGILRTLRRVADAAKLPTLLPIIKKLGSGSSQLVDSDSQVASLVLESFDKSSAKDLCAEDSQSWPVLTAALLNFHSLGKRTSEWNSLLQCLSDGLFASLSSKRQLELALLLIDLATASGDNMSVKPLLVLLFKDVHLICAILKSLQTTLPDNTERTPKRQKADLVTADQADAFSKLTLFAEVLSAQVLPGSLDLLSALLESLAQILSSSAIAQPDLIYVEQLLMTCIESVASQIKEMPNLAPNAIQLNVLVDLMRASENPQTFNQALLLMASLARLAPESVLRNVMPIFTFMGSNVFHRDDSYSFKVIQKTTESIVPVVTSSLRDKYTDHLQLCVGARDFLRTFTDAANHVPRHRRPSFFTHLVNVLGAEEFLAPVTMLLADKLSSRVARQDISDAQTILGLPLSIFQHYDISVQIATITEILAEAKKLHAFVRDPAYSESTILEIPIDEDQQNSTAVLRKRQCQTLLTMVGCCFKQMSPSKALQSMENEISAIITTLLELALFDENAQPNTEFKEIGSASRWSLFQALSINSATSFVLTVNTMLTISNKKIHYGALELLTQRVPLMKVEARDKVSTSMAQVTAKIRDILSLFEDVSIAEESLKALMCIAETSGPAEETALTDTLPVVLETASKRREVASALAPVPLMISKLGPRVIPHLRHIILTCGMVLRDEGANHESIEVSLQALTSALKAVPSFWGLQELKIVIELYLEVEQLASTEAQFDKLVKLISKNISSKMLISALFQSWPALDVLNRQNGRSKFTRFFDLLKRCLHFAKREDVLENLKSLFTNFLSTFEVRADTTADAIELENSIIAAYNELVVKLNETAFQPLFRKFSDWAFGDEARPTRMIPFLRSYSALLDLFKELMTPYMHLLMGNLVDLLAAFKDGHDSDPELWIAAIEMLSKNLSSDDGTVWKDQRLRNISESIIQQIPVCINLKPSNGKALLSDCLASLVDCMDEDPLLQSTNRSILMHTRSEDTRIRLFAVQCAIVTWQVHGRKFRNYGPETATFIMECAEDENDDVVKECHKLKDAVESEVGKIEGL